ncbi:MAG: TonB-dependent receptor [Pseudomonadota bacterium]
MYGHNRRAPLAGISGAAARSLPLLVLAAGVSVPTLAQSEPAEISEEIIVVGSKTGSSRQDLGASVGLFDRERLTQDLIINTEDLFDRTANAFTGTTSFGAYSIRGVNNNGLAGAINNSNALASVVVNQVALGVASGDYVKPSLFDTATAEILRGPQSTIQGPNSLIGAVYINYAEPSFDDASGRILVEGGEFDTLRVAAHQNVVLSEDRLAARLTVERRQSDGAVDNTVTGSDDVQRTDDTSVRAQLLWRPQGTDALTVKATYWYNDSDANPFGLVIPPAGGDIFDREQPYNVEDEYPTEFHLGALEIGWQLNDAWRATSITGISSFDLNQRFDGDLTPFDFLAVSGLIDEELFSQELRLVYDGQRVNALFGFYFSDGDYTSGFAGTGIFPDGMGGVMPFNTTTENLENIQQVALYAQADWRVTDRLSLKTGVRLNREERDNDNFADNNGFISDLSASEEFDQIIPSVAVSYALTEQTSVGVSYARGFQAGGIAFAVFLGQSGAYDEEFTNNYEVFVRYLSADGRLLLNANAFFVDWQDQQVTATLPGGFPGFDDQVLNAGESELRGFEIEAEWQATDALNVFASIGLVDTEFEEFVLNGVDLAGTSFPNAPEYNVALGANLTLPSGWYAAGTLTLVDSAFTELAVPELTRTSKRSLLSGRIGYAADHWRAYAWGRNLLDDDYELGLFNGLTFGLSSAYGRVADPRTLGVGLEFNW